MSGTTEPTPDDQSPANEEAPEEVSKHEYEFLVPGPTPESNQGCFSWGLAWTGFSLFLILVVAIMTVGCYFLARATGMA
jgi:hypothetical protein